MPKSSRPPEIRSSVAACSASSTGLCQGSTMTAVPSRSVRGAHGERGLQHQRGGDLVPAGEMMLDQEARAIAQRLGLDRVVEIVAKALPGFGAEVLGAGLRRAEDSELHSGQCTRKIELGASLMRSMSRRPCPKNEHSMAAFGIGFVPNAAGHLPPKRAVVYERTADASADRHSNRAWHGKSICDGAIHRDDAAFGLLPL